MVEKNKHVLSEENNNGPGHVEHEDGGTFSGTLGDRINSLVGVETPFGVVTGVELREIPAEHVTGSGVGETVHWQSEGVDVPRQPGIEQYPEQ
jgi:hypothetical protein